MTKQQKIAEWLLWGARGESSMTMAAVALGGDGLQYHKRYNSKFAGPRAPLDPADFQRCHMLLEDVPEIREDFDAIARACPEFAPILACWDELAAIYESERDLREAPKLYARMQELRPASPIGDPGRNLFNPKNQPIC